MPKKKISSLTAYAKNYPRETESVSPFQHCSLLPESIGDKQKVAAQARPVALGWRALQLRQRRRSFLWTGELDQSAIIF